MPTYKLTIGGRDYTNFIYNTAQQIAITCPLNKPQTLQFALLDSDNYFGGAGVPTREEKVVLNTSLYGDGTFIGFISAYPVMKLAGYVDGRVLAASIYSSNTIGNVQSNWKTNAYYNFNVRIVSGWGAGQSRRIFSNNASTLTVVPWGTPPDSTSKFVISAPVFALLFTAASEEYQLNAKSSQLATLPTLTGRKSGAIIRKMTEFLLPGKFTYAFDDTAGNYQANFAITAGQVWSDIVAGLGTSDRAHYWVQNGVINYAPFDDNPLGLVYDTDTDSTVTGWNVANMAAQAKANQIQNDVIMVGGDAPLGMGKAFFVGDGFQGNFYLQLKAFGIEAFSLVNETWQNGIPVQGGSGLVTGTANPGTWEVGPGSGLVQGMGNLQYVGGSGITQSYVRLLKAVELSGSLTLIHGELQFGGQCDGLIGCLYQDFTDLSLSGVISGFRLTNATGYVGYLTFDGANVLDGDTITAGVTTYTFRLILAAPNDVLIGPVVGDSLNHLILAINVSSIDGVSNSGEGQVYGIGTAANPVAEASLQSTLVIQISSPINIPLQSTSAHVAASIMAASPQTKIQGLVKGATVGDTVVTRANHSYVLITRLHCREIFPWSQVYTAVRDSTVVNGGDISKSQIFISYEVWDYNITTNPTLAPSTITPTKYVLYSDVVDLLSTLPSSFLAYSIIQANAMNIAINFTEIAYPYQALLETKKPILDVATLVPKDYAALQVRSLGYGIDEADATIVADQTGHILEFYPTPVSNLPVAGEVMELFFRVLGTAIGRYQDPTSIASIAAKYGPPDNGIRTLIVSNFIPKLRTPQDARNAAATQVADSIHADYDVTYKVYCDYVTGRPWPGRMLAVNGAEFEIPTKLLVSEVDIEIYGDLVTKLDKAFITVKCGTQLNADTFAAMLNRRGPSFDMTDVASVSALDVFSVSAAYLNEDINDWGMQPYGLDQYLVAISDPVIPSGYQIEVRKWDKGWGQIQVGKQDTGLICRTAANASQFYIPREARTQQFYMRFLHNGVYSADSSYCIVSWPLPPPFLLSPTALADDDYSIVVSFTIQNADFQDLWRIIITGPAAHASYPDDNTIYANILWDATTFAYNVKITRNKATQQPWDIGAILRLYTYNLFGERTLTQCHLYPKVVPFPPTNLLLYSDENTVIYTLAGLVDSILVTWTPPQDADLDGDIIQVQYREMFHHHDGLVTIQAGGFSVTGNATSWTPDMADGQFVVGGIYYDIKSIDSPTQLTLKTGYLGIQTAGSPYDILYGGPWHGASSATGDATQVVIGGVTDGTQYQVQIRSRDVAGFVSVWVQGMIVASGAAIPFPWKPYGEAYPWAKSGYSYQLVREYAQFANATSPDQGLPILTAKGVAPVNVESDTLKAPVIDQFAKVVSAGNNLPVMAGVIQVFAIDGTGLRSPGSDLCHFKTTAAGQQVTFNVTWWPNGAVAYEVFIGPDEDGMIGQGYANGLIPTVVLNAINLKGYGPPDPRAKTVLVRGKHVVHGGIGTTGSRDIAHIDASTSSINIDVDPTLTPIVDELQGRYLIRMEGDLSTQLIGPIISNDAGSPLCRVVVPGQYDNVMIPQGTLFVISTNTTLAGGNFIEDIRWQSPWGSVNGLDTDAEIAKIVRIVYDPTGVSWGATATATSNSNIRINTTQFKLFDGTPVTPANGSQFIVEEPSWVPNQITSIAHNAYSPGIGTLGDVSLTSILSAPFAGQIVLVQVLLRDDLVNVSDESTDTLRMLYVPVDVASGLIVPNRD